jgi:hypothetical protein
VTAVICERVGRGGVELEERGGRQKRVKDKQGIHFLGMVALGHRVEQRSRDLYEEKWRRWVRKIVVPGCIGRKKGDEGRRPLAYRAPDLARGMDLGQS